MTFPPLHYWFMQSREQLAAVCVRLHTVAKWLLPLLAVALSLFGIIWKQLLACNFNLKNELGRTSSQQPFSIIHFDLIFHALFVYCVFLCYFIAAPEEKDQ